MLHNAKRPSNITDSNSYSLRYGSEIDKGKNKAWHMSSKGINFLALIHKLVTDRRIRPAN